MEGPRIALVTARAARKLDADLPPLEAALRNAGADPQVVDWDEQTADWGAFDLAVLRSPWDYTKHLPEFLNWVDRVSESTMLLNPATMLRWNLDKHYLGELSRAGVPTVPSEFIELDADVPLELKGFLARQSVAEFVVKPSVGAGSRDVQRYVCSDMTAAIAHAQCLIDAGRSVLLQPYLARVDEVGETALMYFEGQFSHAIRKGPLLKRGHSPTSVLFAPEAVTARVPQPDELETAARVLAAVPFGTLLYARVDLIRDAAGAPCLLELEAAEPSLFFVHGPGSAQRLAGAILERAKRH